MKKITAFALVIILALSLVSCGGNSLIGDWTVSIADEELSYEGETVSLDLTMSFKKNGTCSMGIWGFTVDGTYVVSGDRLNIKFVVLDESEEMEFVYRVENDELHLIVDGEETTVLTKVK